MAHACAPQTNAVRRRRPHRRGPRARLDRRPRPALTGGGAQARQQTRCRWPRGAQLPKPVARPRHLHTQRDDHHPERGLQLYLGSHPDPDPGPSLRPARRRSNQAVASKRHSRRELSKQDQSYASRRSKNFSLKALKSQASYSTGTKIECRILPSTCCDKWPLPVVSSTRTTSPTPISRLSPSLAVIFTPASRLMMYCRRGAGCQSMSCSAWVLRKMIPVAGRRLESLLPRRSSIHSTSMSRKCDWPLASVYRLCTRIALSPPKLQRSCRPCLSGPARIQSRLTEPLFHNAPNLRPVHAAQAQTLERACIRRKVLPSHLSDEFDQRINRRRSHSHRCTQGSHRDQAGRDVFCDEFVMEISAYRWPDRVHRRCR